MRRLQIRFIFLLALLAAPLSVVAQDKGETSKAPVVPWGGMTLDERPLPKTAAEAKALLAKARKERDRLDAKDPLRAPLDRQVKALENLAATLEALEGLEARKEELARQRERLAKKKAALEKKLKGPPDPAPLRVTESMLLDARSKSEAARAELDRAQGAYLRAQTQMSGLGAAIEASQAAVDAAAKSLQEAEAAYSAKTTAAGVDAAELAVLAEDVYAKRLDHHRLQMEWTLKNRQRDLTLPDLEVQVAALQKDAADAQAKLAARWVATLETVDRKVREEALARALENRDKVAAWIREVPDFERPYFEARVRLLDLEAEAARARLKLADWTKETGPEGDVGLAQAATEFQAQLIEEQKREPEASVFPEEADALRRELDRTKNAEFVFRAARKDLREQLSWARRRLHGAGDVDEGVLSALDEAFETWKKRTDNGRLSPRRPRWGEPPPVDEAAWQSLRDELSQVVRLRRENLVKLQDTLTPELSRLRKLQEQAESNRLAIARRLLWSREASHISMDSLEEAIDDAGSAVDALDEIPGRVWRRLKAFVVDPTRRNRVIWGGIALLALILGLILVHRKMPQTIDFLEHQKGRLGFGSFLALVLRRTDFSLMIALVFVGLPWALGLTRDVVGVMAALFLSPFLYRLGRVILDVLLVDREGDPRFIQVDDDLARILEKSGKTLLNLAVVFVPVGALLEAAGYDGKNPGFVELWWLVYKVVSQLVVLFTVFRPVVIRRLIRGDNVVATSFRNWILLGYPLILGAFLFVFVLGSLRYRVAESFFAVLFAKTLAALLAGYVLYRFLLRRFFKAKDLNRKLNPDDFEKKEAFQDEGRKLFLDRLLRLTLRVVVFGLVFFFLYRAWSSLGFDWLRVPLSSDGEGLTPLGILRALLAILVTVVVVRTLRQYLTFFVAPRMKLDQGLSYTMVTLSSYLVIAIGLIIALRTLRVRGEQIAVVMSALMIGVGFGLQSIVKNFVSGLILLVERPVQVGDRIEVGDKSGVVEKITLRATSVMTWDGVGIVIPNEEMIGSKLVNQSLGRPRLRASLLFGVSYSADVQRVRTLVNEVVSSHGLVLKRPSPEVFFIGFGDNSLDFRVVYWTAIGTHRGRVASDLRFAIDAGFRREGIEIPFPQRDLHLRSVDDVAAQTMRGAGGPENDEKDPAVREEGVE